MLRRTREKKSKVDRVQNRTPFGCQGLLFCTIDGPGVIHFGPVRAQGAWAGVGATGLGPWKGDGDGRTENQYIFRKIHCRFPLA